MHEEIVVEEGGRLVTRWRGCRRRVRRVDDERVRWRGYLQNMIQQAHNVAAWTEIGLPAAGHGNRRRSTLMKLANAGGPEEVGSAGTMTCLLPVVHQPTLAGRSSPTSSGVEVNSTVSGDSWLGLN